MNKSDEGSTVSYWEATKDLLKGAVSPPASADVCIIGAGISGLTTAYLIAKKGHSVAVLDDGLIGGGETSRTTAHLSNAIDDRIYRIEEWHGAEKAALAVEAHTKAIDLIESIAREENIECDFSRVDGYLFEAPDGEDNLAKEIEAARRCGLSVEWADRAPISGADKCLRFPRQGQFHVLKYLNGLAAAVERLGGTLVSNAHVEDWTGGESPTVTIEGEIGRASCRERV